MVMGTDDEKDECQGLIICQVSANKQTVANSSEEARGHPGWLFPIPISSSKSAVVVSTS